MKKQLVASLAAAMVLGVAGTSFAAANPFTDVPAKHWAYDSVMKLSQAGIVDGYGDGTYRGDKLISRYEMAQMVAKAMAKSDKADAAQKAQIDKLAAEFAEELNVLGVRVTKLEKGASSIKFTGDARVRWNNTENKADTQQFRDRFRLNMTSQVNANTSLYARFVFSDDSFNQDSAQRLSDLAFTTKGLIGNTTDVTVGRYSLYMGQTGSLSDTTGDIEGIMTKTKSGNFGLMAGYAQARNNAPASLVKNNKYIKNIAFTEASYTTGKAKFTADYFKNLNVGKNDGAPTAVVFNLDGTVKTAGTAGHAVVDAFQIVGGGVGYTFDKNFKVTGEYYKNDASGSKLADGSAPTATIARVQYKGAVAAKPQSWGLAFEYNKFEGNSLPYGFQGPFHKENYTDVGYVAADNNGLKSYVAQVDYTLAKNVTFNGVYQFNIKNALTGADAPSKTFSRAQVNFMF